LYHSKISVEELARLPIEVKSADGCSPTDGVAKNVAKRILSTDTQDPQKNPSLSRAFVSWIGAELGAYVGPNGIIPSTNPQTGQLEYTYVAWDGTIELAPPPPGADGIIHNHPLYEYVGPIDDFDIREPDYQKLDRYPSANDWDALDILFERNSNGDPNFDPSLYVIDGFGVMREFSLSERVYFESLTRDQRLRGIGLPSEMDLDADGLDCDQDAGEDDSGDDPDGFDNGDADDAGYDNPDDNGDDEPDGEVIFHGTDDEEDEELREE